jgi:ketosteroid isomerase-like protein
MRFVTIALILASATPPHPPAFEEMAEAERAFARRAQDVSVHQAFMEYFADDAVGFESGEPASAQAQMRKRPVQPRDPNVLFWWEPRYGDIAASGDLGWLTGPARFGRKDEPGKVRHGSYASVWRRQSDGRFKVIIDIGIDPPGEVPFAPGLVRMPLADRYTGAEIVPLARASLLAADRSLNAAARTSPSAAFAKVAAPAIRLHRNGFLPIEGRENAVAWLATQPALASADSLLAETAASSDLGYTWGSYERGHYVRVWVRDASGAWRVALDLDAPKPSRP